MPQVSSHRSTLQSLGRVRPSPRLTDPKTRTGFVAGLFYAVHAIGRRCLNARCLQAAEQNRASIRFGPNFSPQVAHSRDAFLPREGGRSATFIAANEVDDAAVALAAKENRSSTM